MKLSWNNGLMIKLKKTTVSLDPHRVLDNVDITLISHAHSDHTIGFKNKGRILSTKETYDIYSARNGTTELKNITYFNYNQTLKEKDFSIKTINSGHVLGSCQFYISDKNESVLFTSDLNYVKTATLEPAEPIKTDILIIESTYGRPEYIMPPRSEIYADIVEWCITQLNNGKVPIFKVYSLGKSQELIKILNNYLKVPVVVDANIAKISNFYLKKGVTLNFSTLNNTHSTEILKEKKGVLLISSKSQIPKYLIPNEYSLATATGWALKFRPKGYDASFPLSSHADYYQLLEFIKECSPKKVFTIHGYSREFAYFIRKKFDIPAYPITDLNQQKLTDFV
ncbi:MAG: MBL fold metallo-hydrolase RNA specificity domain-containing protein [Candidatus Odinarchaeia archaeon]